MHVVISSKENVALVFRGKTPDVDYCCPLEAIEGPSASILKLTVMFFTCIPEVPQVKLQARPVDKNLPFFTHVFYTTGKHELVSFLFQSRGNFRMYRNLKPNVYTQQKT